MKISEGLEKLIEAALRDGKITNKERAILLNKAIKEGNEEEEFLMYLDSLTQTKGGTSRSLLKRFKNYLMEEREIGFGPFKQKQNRLPQFIIVLIFFIGGPILYNVLTPEDHTEEFGCANIEDCLSKFKFEEARIYYAESIYADKKDLRDIITGEISYYCANDKLELANRTLSEYVFDQPFKQLATSYENDDYNEEAEWYNDQVLILIEKSKDRKKDISILFEKLKPTSKLIKLEQKDEDSPKRSLYSFEKDFTKINSIKNKYK